MEAPIRNTPSDHSPALPPLHPKKGPIQEYKIKYCHRYGRDEQQAVTITFAEKKAGGKEKLEAAIQTGEVTVFEDPGTGHKFYKWRTLTAGTESGAKDITKIGGQQRITRAMMDEAAKEIDKMSWKFMDKPGAKLAIEDGKLPQELVDRIQKIVRANEKVVKESMNCMHALGNSSSAGAKDKRNELKAAIDATLEASKPLGKLERFKETTSERSTIQAIKDKLGVALVSAKKLYELAAAGKAMARFQKAKA